MRIRATRGRSTERQRDRETERQRDRESRPNPLKDQGDSRKALGPAAFARFAARSHSFAKQASKKFAKRFGKFDFGRLSDGFGGPKWRPASLLETFFCDAFFERFSESIRDCLRSFFRGPNLDSTAQAQCFVRIRTFATCLVSGRFCIKFRLKIDVENRVKSLKVASESQFFGVSIFRLLFSRF